MGKRGDRCSKTYEPALARISGVLRTEPLVDHGNVVLCLLG